MGVRTLCPRHYLMTYFPLIRSAKCAPKSVLGQFGPGEQFLKVFGFFRFRFQMLLRHRNFENGMKNSESIRRRLKAVLLNCPALKTYVVFFERRKTSCSVLQRLRNVRNWFPQFWAVDTENERESSSEHQWRRFMKKKLRNSICKRPLRSPGSAFELRWT